MSYIFGLNPTTPQFSDYVNNSSDWANINKEIDYFLGFADSEHEFERVDAKGYILTCMFKISVAVKEFEDGTRKEDPRVGLSDKATEMLGNDHSSKALSARIKQYGEEIIKDHGGEQSAAALSAIASVYGVMAYMNHKELLSADDSIPQNKSKKFFNDMPSDKMPEVVRQNIALAMEKFEESAKLGNVRSMGSLVMWAERSEHPEYEKLNNLWTPKAATSETPNPNSQIDYGRMFLRDGKVDDALEFFSKAASYGLVKAQKELSSLVVLRAAKDSDDDSLDSSPTANKTEQNVR